MQGVLDGFKATFPGRVLFKYLDDQGGTLGTVLAYQALFSMFPIALALLTILGIVLRDQTTLERVQNGLASALPSDPALAETLNNALKNTSQSVGWLSLISLGGLLWSASTLFGSMEQAFNAVFHAPPRAFWQSKLVGVGMIFLFATLLVVSILSGSATTLLLQFADQIFQWLGVDVKSGALVIGWLVSILSGFALFLALFWIVPNRRFTFRQALPGAAFTAIAFFLFTQILFPLYSTTFGNFNRYGQSLSLAFLLLTWFSYVGLILLIGAEINSVLLDLDREPARAGIHPLRDVTVERGRRLTAGMAARTPAPAAALAGGSRRSLARYLPLGVLGVLTCLWALLRWRR